MCANVTPGQGSAVATPSLGNAVAIPRKERSVFKLVRSGKDKLKGVRNDEAKHELPGGTHASDVIDEDAASDDTDNEDDDDVGNVPSPKKTKNQQGKPDKLGIARGIFRAVRKWSFKDWLHRFSAAVWIAVTCNRRERRRVREANRWLQFKDREKRKFVIREKQLAQTRNRSKFQLDAGDLPRHRQLWRTVVKLKTYFLLQLTAFAAERLGYQDKRTGLPSRLIETWRFVRLVREAKHGYLYEAIDPSGKMVAVVVRDKSLGHVVQLPLERAANVLRHYMVPRRSFLGRLLIWFGIRQQFVHKGAVKLYAVFDNAEFYVEVSEYLRGGSLDVYIDNRTKPLDEYTACHIFTQLLLALKYLHSHRLMHRDVRLAQVLLVDAGKEDPDVKLSDFWCVARIPRSRVLVDRARAVDVSTSAAEVVKTGDWSDKSDIWSAGCILFQLLYGHPPFGGEGNALLERICTQDPEFDMLCGRASDHAVDLLKLLLHRQPFSRPTAKAALEHRWFSLFTGRKPEKLRSTEPHRIVNVSICGNAPMSRLGMPAKNLICAEVGMLNAGFCTYPGSTTCSLELKVGEGEEEGVGVKEMYFVSQIVVSLWGNEDNPRDISVQAKLRLDGAYFTIASSRIEAVDTTEVSIDIKKPLMYVRIRFNGNFGGVHGLALRKIRFYGFEICSVPVIADLDKVAFLRGAHVHRHAEVNESQIRQGMVHPSLRRDLKKGNRIPGTGAYYQEYRDVHSGPQHTTTVTGMLVPPLPEAGLRATFASWSLRYASECGKNLEPPKVSILKEQEGDGAQGKLVLFTSDELHDSEVKPEEVVSKGYALHRPMYLDDIRIPLDKEMGIEVAVSNNSGYCHFPSDFGLTFYYIPELPPFDEEVDPSTRRRKLGINADEVKASNLVDSAVAPVLVLGVETMGGACVVDNLQDTDSPRTTRDIQTTLTPAEAPAADGDEDYVEETVADQHIEAELKDDMEHLNTTFQFGKWGGRSDFTRSDYAIWNPNSDAIAAAELVYREPDCHNQKLWWGSEVPPLSQTSTIQSQTASRPSTGIQSQTASRPWTLETQQQTHSRAMEHIPENEDDHVDAMLRTPTLEQRRMKEMELMNTSRSKAEKERKRIEQQRQLEQRARRTEMGACRMAVLQKEDHGGLVCLQECGGEEVGPSPCVHNLCRQLPCSEGGLGRACPQGYYDQGLVCVRPVLQGFTPPAPPATPRESPDVASHLPARPTTSEPDAAELPPPPPAAAEGCVVM